MGRERGGLYTLEAGGSSLDLVHLGKLPSTEISVGTALSESVC